MSKLTEIGELWFREARGLEQTKNLEEEGYWFEKNKFALNDNFFISRDGLGFAYNQYEIAPYALGISTFVIPFRELKEIISKNSVLRRFIPGN